MNCVKRGWPSRLRKGEEHELESKPLFVLFSPYMLPPSGVATIIFFKHNFVKRNCWLFLGCYSATPQRGGQRTRHHHFFFLQCNSMKRIMKTCWVCHDFICCYSTTLQRGQWQHLVGDCFFFLLLCNFAKRTMMTTTCWVHRCFFLPRNATPWRGGWHAPIASAKRMKTMWLARHLFILFLLHQKWWLFFFFFFSL